MVPVCCGGRVLMDVNMGKRFRLENEENVLLSVLTSALTVNIKSRKLWLLSDIRMGCVISCLRSNMFAVF